MCNRRNCAIVCTLHRNGVCACGFHGQPPLHLLVSIVQSFCPPPNPPRLPNHLQTPLKLPFPDKSHGLPWDQILIAFISLNFQFPTILFNGIPPLIPFHTFLVSFNRFSCSYLSLSSAPSFHICFSSLKKHLLNFLSGTLFSFMLLGKMSYAVHVVTSIDRAMVFCIWSLH